MISLLGLDVIVLICLKKEEKPALLMCEFEYVR